MQVKISLSMLMNYEQVVNMSKEYFEQLKDTDCEDIMWTDEKFHIIEKYLDYSDILDNDGEFKDVSVSKFNSK